MLQSNRIVVEVWLWSEKASLIKVQKSRIARNYQQGKAYLFAWASYQYGLEYL